MFTFAEIQKASWEYFVIKLPACSLLCICFVPREISWNRFGKWHFKLSFENSKSMRFIECSMIFERNESRLQGNLLPKAGGSESQRTHVIAECNGRVKQPINSFERQIALRSDGNQATNRISVLFRVLSSGKTNKTVLFIFRVALGHEPARKRGCVMCSSSCLCFISNRLHRNG